MSNVWVFGYGSLIWRPDFAYLQKRVGTIDGWSRRFWQGSHDHRGVPDAPGRVVTLVPEAGAQCSGMAFQITGEEADDVFGRLDFREKNGYERHLVDCTLTPNHGITDAGAEQVRCVVYVAGVGNSAYLGPDTMDAMVEQIRASRGPSGRNSDYLIELARALRRLGLKDEHVFELESRL